MAVDKVPAKDWKFEINTGTVPAPVWTQIKGLQTIGMANSATRTDTTTNDDAGQETHMVLTRGRTLKLEGQYLEDAANKQRDPGQQAVEDLAELVGAASLKQFRSTSPAGTTRTFLASAVIPSLGDGGTKDTSKWAADIQVSGTVTKV